MSAQLSEADSVKRASFLCSSSSMNKSTSVLGTKDIDESFCKLSALHSMWKLIVGPLQTPVQISAHEYSDSRMRVRQKTLGELHMMSFNDCRYCHSGYFKNFLPQKDMGAFKTAFSSASYNWWLDNFWIDCACVCTSFLTVFALSFCSICACVYVYAFLGVCWVASLHWAFFN